MSGRFARIGSAGQAVNLLFARFFLIYRYGPALKPILIHANTPEELTGQLESLSLNRGSGLALVFAQDRILSPQYLEPFFRQGIQVFGSCAAEPIFQDRVFSDSLVALILDIPDHSYKLKIYPPESDQRILGKRLGQDMKSSFQSASLLLLVAPGNLQVSPESVLQGVFEESPGAAVFGAIPSSFGRIEKPPFFTDREIIDAGLYALFLDRNFVELSGMAVSGWKELGTPKRITRSLGREVLEIEGLPATDFYTRYFDLKTSGDSRILNHIDPDLMAAGEYPLLLRGEDGTEVMRAAIQMDGNRKSVTYGGEIPEGSLVRFCSPNTIETIEHSVSEMEGFRDGLMQNGADAVLMFNCALRSRSFGQYMQRELEAIHRLWDVPLAGFSSWGEIGTTKGQSCGLHNTVISVVALRLLDEAASPESSGAADSKEPSESRDQRYRFAPGEIRNLVESQRESSLEALQKEVDQLRREKRILGHFLRLTAGDLEREQKKSDDLLLNILPASIAERLKQGAQNISDRVQQASILFADLVGFTVLSSTKEPAELVSLLNDIFTEFDRLSQDLGVEKIKTIGDAYMAAAGVPEPVPDHARRCLSLGKSMLAHMKEINRKHSLDLDLRVGIHCGPVAAGVIGTHKFSYDLWGDTVNTAQRMESHGEAGTIQISESVFDALENPGDWQMQSVDVKGKGTMRTYLWKATT